MMNRWRYLCAALILLLLSACAAQQPGTTSPGSTAPKAKPSAVKVTDLPCAETSKAEALQVNYPAESLYRSGAALPTQNGLVCLQALSGWLKTVSDTPLLLSVSGEEGHEFAAKALATKRQELLQRYFERQGIDSEAWQWSTEKDSGFQLQISETN
jgi:hypothetical protein